MNRDDVKKRLVDHGNTFVEDTVFDAFCGVMLDYEYGGDALETAWHFFQIGWNSGRTNLMVTYAYEKVALEQAVRVAEAIRDDARAASQQYLDEKRELEARLKGLEK